MQKKMFPMDFEEFCIANKVSQKVLDYLRDCFEKVMPVDEVINETILKLYYLYLIVGGMPAVVKKYLETNNLQDVVQEQEYISRLYKDYIAKYDEKEKIHLRDIYELIPSELNKQNKKFKVNSVKNGIKYDRLENAFLWLTDAGVALPVFCANEPKMPLSMYLKNKEVEELKYTVNVADLESRLER